MQRNNVVMRTRCSVNVQKFRMNLDIADAEEGKE